MQYAVTDKKAKAARCKIILVFRGQAIKSVSNSDLVNIPAPMYSVYLYAKTCCPVDFSIINCMPGFSTGSFLILLSSDSASAGDMTVLKCRHIINSKEMMNEKMKGDRVFIFIFLPNTK